MQKVKCKCGKEILYSNGGLHKRHKKQKCFDCEMKKYFIALRKCDNSIDNSKKM